MHTPPLVEEFDNAQHVINNVYPKLMPEMAKAMGIKLIDIFEPLSRNLEANFEDIIHPNAEGYGIMAQCCKTAMGL